MKTPKICFIILAAILSITMLSACGASSYDYATTEAATFAEAPEATTYSEDSASYDEGFYNESAEQSGSAAQTSTDVLTPQDSNRKIIYTTWMNLQATDFDETAGAVQAAVQAAGGYISSKYIYDQPYEDSVPYGSFECRIPQENYSDFINEVGDVGYVLSLEENSEDVTLQYVDIEARITSLRTQEESLMEMLETASDVDTLVVIQTSLMEVQYQIESYTSQIRTLNDLISYSTVTIDIEEVYEYTPPTPETFTSRIASAFSNSWQDFSYFAQDFAVALVYALPGLIVLAVIVIIIVIIVRKNLKKAKNKPKLNNYPYGVAANYSLTGQSAPNAENAGNANAPIYSANIEQNSQNNEQNDDSENKSE